MAVSMKWKNRLNLLLVSAFSMAMLSCATSGDGMTTVVVVRHAEKRIEPENRDPMLTSNGLVRAETLAGVLKDVGIEGVYSSDYHRTRLTAAPTALQAGVETVLYDPRDSDGLRDAILRDHRGGTVLAVGHSNTVPALLASLGVEDPPKIGDDQYDDCFFVLIPDQPVAGGAETALIHLHYGEIAPAATPHELPEKP
jgi:phosphohistidine phosphatase SixA